MQRKRKQLPIPEWAQEEPNSFEALRVWIVSGEVYCSALVDEGPFKDHKAWGLLLAEVAKQIAVEHSEEEPQEPEDVLVGIIEEFDAETEHLNLDPVCHFPESEEGSAEDEE